MVLKKHPEIFLPSQKEIMFFTRHYTRELRWYEGFFAQHNGEKYAADISPAYLSNPDVPRRIKNNLSEVKLIAVLRNPPEQIWSLYNLWLTRGYTTKSLDLILDPEGELLNNVMYFRHISNYLEHFDRKNMLILFYEDLKADPVSFLRSIYGFLDISDLYEDDFANFWNQTRSPRSRVIEKVITKTGEFLHRSGRISLKSWFNKIGVTGTIKRINTRPEKAKTIPSDLRLRINDYVLDDKKNLETLVSRDLSFWK